MEKGDKEIQEILDNKLFPVNCELDQDHETYRLLYDSLNKKPAEGLPLSFSSVVTSRVQAKLDRRVSFRWYILFPIVLFLLAIASYYYIAYVDVANSVYFLVFIQKFKWAFLFGSTCFLAIEYFDRKFVKGSGL